MGPELEENCSENTFKEVHRALVNVDALPELFPIVHDTLQASLALPVPLIQNIKVFESEMEMRSHLASPFTVRTRTVVCAAPPAAPATRGKLLLSNQLELELESYFYPITCNLWKVTFIQSTTCDLCSLDSRSCLETSQFETTT